MNKKENQRDNESYTEKYLQRFRDILHEEGKNLKKIPRRIDQTILRKKNKPTRFFVDNEYIDNGYLATFPHQVNSVYMAMLKHCNTNSQTAFPGLKRLQRLAGIKNRNSIISSIEMLEDFNIVTVIRTKGGTNNPNTYGFVSSDLWRVIDPTLMSRKLTIKQYQKKHP